MNNVFKLLADLQRKPPFISSDIIQTQHKLSSEEAEVIRRIGISAAQLSRSMQIETQVNYDRARLYQEVTRGIEHPLVGAAVELYADYSTNYNYLQNASVWVTSESDTYQKELTDLLDRIGVEEKIFDWAWNTGAFGDLFIKVNGSPGLGVISIQDDDHPLNVSRVDHEGILIGFYETPQGQNVTKQIIPPWEYTHFRLLGSKRRRPLFSDPLYAEFRTVHLLAGTDTKQVTSRYGTSLLINALPIWKRLRMAEDSLLLARLTRGVIRYIWKLKVGGCLSGDTQIRMLDGSVPTIKEMAENANKYIGKSVWVVDKNTTTIGKIRKVGKTHLNAQLVRVHLNNGKYVDCTPDHKFLLYFGDYKEARNLEANTALYPSPGTKLGIKVIKVEKLSKREDTYDIEINKKTPNFLLEAGIFVHNSNAEAVAAMMDEMGPLIKRARAIDTRQSSPFFDSREQPMGVMEDLFLPVWGETNDLTFDKIGGEADIRWIVDIQDLRDQLAKALRCPLVLLGGKGTEAGGPLSDHSQAIEKLDIRFARSARRLQRAVKEGIKRICQIHLAWRNMDPDQNLFEVNMSETSTAEEESLRDTLDKNVDVCDKFLGMLKEVDPDIDQKKVLDYLNRKILKLGDFDPHEFLAKVSTLEGRGKLEVLQEAVNYFKKISLSKNSRSKPIFNLDTRASLPFEGSKAKVHKPRIVEQCQEKWQENFGNVQIKEDKGIRKSAGNQLTFNW